MGQYQRGAIVAQNDNGTLEQVDGSSTFVGSATFKDGKVVTKRFRDPSKDPGKVIPRWEKWQYKVWDKEDELEIVGEETFEMIEDQEPVNKQPDISVPVEDKEKCCPFNKLLFCSNRCALWNPVHRECSFYLMGSGIFNMSTNMMKLDPNESLELIAMSVDGAKASTQPSSGCSAKSSAEEGIEKFLEGKTFLSFVNLHSKSVHPKYKGFCKRNGYEPVSESALSDAILDKYPELGCEKGTGGRIFLAKGV